MSYLIINHYKERKVCTNKHETKKVNVIKVMSPRKLWCTNDFTCDFLKTPQ